MIKAILNNSDELNRLLHVALKKLRKNQGLNQTEVADLLGKDQVFVSNSETGRRQLDPVELLAFCNIYGISPGELLKSILDRHHEDFTEIFDGCEATSQPESPDEEPGKKVPRLNTPIINLPLSDRIHNVLPRKIIENLCSLLEYKPPKLKKIRALGPSIVSKITNFTNEFTFRVIKKHAAELFSNSKSEAKYATKPLHNTDTPFNFMSLDIKEKTNKFLKEKDFQTIEEFLAVDKKDMTRTRSVGKKTVKRLLRLQNQLNKALEVAEQKTEKIINIFHNQPEWIRNKNIKFLPVFGLGSKQSTTLQNFLDSECTNRSLRHLFVHSKNPEQLPFKIEKKLKKLQRCGNLLEYWKNRMPEIIERTFNDLENREFNILCHRFTLKSKKKKTLKETKKLFNITQKQIKKIEEKALLKIDSSLLWGIIAMLDEILIYSGGLASVKKLRAHNSIKYWGDYRIPGFIDLLMKTNRLPVYGGGQYIIHSNLDEDYVEEFTNYILGYIESQGRPVSFSELKETALEKMLEAFKEDLARLDITPETFLESILEVEKNIGTDPMGKIGLSKWPEVNPATYIEWAIVALRSIEQPAHWKEILRKAEAISGEKFKEKTFYNIFSPSDEFRLFDSGNGVYGLDEWKDRFDEKTNQTIAELAYLTVKEKGPLTPDEVHNYILEEKDCSRNSVSIYLEGDPRLIKKEEHYHLHPEHKKMGHFKDDRGEWGGVKGDDQLNRIKKILEKNGEAMPVLEIARKMSIKYADGPFHVQNLSQILPDAKKIVNIGQGYYGLKSNGYQKLSYLEAVEKTAKNMKQDSFTVKKIHKHVLEIRKMGLSTVHKMVTESGKIQKIQKGVYAFKPDISSGDSNEKTENQSSYNVTEIDPYL